MILLKKKIIITRKGKRFSCGLNRKTPTFTTFAYRYRCKLISSFHIITFRTRISAIIFIRVQANSNKTITKTMSTLFDSSTSNWLTNFCRDDKSFWRSIITFIRLLWPIKSQSFHKLQLTSVQVYSWMFSVLGIWHIKKWA